MKITINESSEFEDLEIIINCNKINDSLLKVYKYLKMKGIVK